MARASPSLQKSDFSKYVLHQNSYLQMSSTPHSSANWISYSLHTVSRPTCCRCIQGRVLGFEYCRMCHFVCPDVSQPIHHPANTETVESILQNGLLVPVADQLKRQLEFCCSQGNGSICPCLVRDGVFTTWCALSRDLLTKRYPSPISTFCFV